MKAALLTAIGQIELTDIPDPAIEHDDHVLLRLSAVGVCGSDVHYYHTGRIGQQIVDFPFLLGHECAATVVQVGSAVQTLKAGDQVAVDPAIVCHRCDQCLAGRENTCRKLKFLGCPGQLPGCLCELMVMPAECLYPLDGRISPAQAVLCEPLSVGIYAARQAHLPDTADVAILGAGPIGLSVLLAAGQNSIRTSYLTDKIPARLQAARTAGATWTGNPDRQDIVKEILDQQPAGLDAVFECAGEQDTIDQAVELLKPGGKLMLVGIPAIDRVSFVIDNLRRREITVVNVRRQNRCVAPALDLVASGSAPVDFMLTHRFNLDQTKQAFELVSDYRDGVIKALIEF